MPQLVKVRTKADLGLYAQDRWTIKRLTLNYGLRLEYYNAYVPATQLAAGPLVGARDLPKVSCLPCWTDLDPRVGLAYDLFGTGRTALKTSLGRYVGRMSTAGRNRGFRIAHPVSWALMSLSRRHSPLVAGRCAC